MSAPAALATSLPTFANVLRAVLWPRGVPLWAVVRRLDEVISGSFVLVAVAVGCVGAAMADQAARQALRLLGDQSFIGPEYIVLGMEEFGPLIVALTLAQRTGASFAAAIATHHSDDTYAALALYGAKPMERMVAPMGLALPVAAVVLGLLGFVVWELSGTVALYFRAEINPFTFFHPEAVKAHSVVLSVTKSALFGALLFGSAVWAGLSARAGADEVGKATTKAVVAGVVCCLAANLVLDMVWFLVVR